MSWKGRHDRNWVRLDDGYRSEYEVHHDINSNSYGVFGIVGYEDEWMVFWRPNRNCTTDYYTRLMTHKVESSYAYSGYRNEAVVYKSEDEAVESVNEHWQANFLHPPKRRRYRPRDSQKGKVYRWEHKMAAELGAMERRDGWSRDTAILERKWDHLHLRTYLTSVLQVLGEKEVVLKFRSGGSNSFGGTEIQLLPVHCTHLVLLHELAHVLHKRWGTKTNKQKHQAHGKEFIGIFAYLLVRFGSIDKSEIISHARKNEGNLLLPERFWEWEKAERNTA